MAVVRIEQVTPILSAVHNVTWVRVFYRCVSREAVKISAVPTFMLEFAVFSGSPAALSIPLRSGEG